MDEEEELLDWLCNVYAAAGNQNPVVDLTEYSITLQNNQIVEIKHERSDSESGTASRSSDAE